MTLTMMPCRTLEPTFAMYCGKTELIGFITASLEAFLHLLGDNRLRTEKDEEF
jgi:hypothetical protein